MALQPIRNGLFGYFGWELADNRNAGVANLKASH
jgi:hypothetical protein